MQLKPIRHKITHWETWDWRIKYIPIVPVWLLNCFRARSWWFFTPSNPKLEFGGFEGVTKMSIYEHLPPATYPKTVGVKANIPFSELEQTVSETFQYPFAVKPDVGRMGYMFRIISNSAQLRLYHEAMLVNYVVQEFVTYPLEVSVFYYRFPNEAKGTVTGFVRKEFLEVVGDGTSTLDELMTACPKLRFRLPEMRAKHADKLHFVLQNGERICMSNALNLSRGCSLKSLDEEIDARLVSIFDEISSYSDTLYYGRYDIKCASIDDLKEGKNFSILEYNGCGAEPHHVYGNGNTLFTACRILARHWNILYQISKEHRKRGVRYYRFNQGWKTMRNCRKYFHELKKIDANFPEF